MKRRVLAGGLLVLVFALVLVLAVFVPVAFAAAEETDQPAVPIAASQLWGLLVSIAVPFVVGLLATKAWPKWAKTVTAFVLSAIVGLVTTYVSGKWSGDVWVIVLACYGTAQTTFWLIVERWGIKDWLLSHFIKGKALPSSP